MALAAAGAACAVFVLLGVLVSHAVASSTAMQFDELLQTHAALALRYAEHEYQEGESVVPGATFDTPHVMPFEVVYQITNRANEILYRSVDAPLAPLAVGGGNGYSNITLNGESWRVYSLVSATTPLQIHMAEPLRYHSLLMMRTLKAVALPLFAALGMLAILIALVTELAFRPVRRIAADLAGRGADDLSPVNTAEMPIETHPLGVALNGLLARHAEVLSRERRFTADAAHELRTPLAALRAQAQVASRATTPTETRHALDKLQASIDRTTHLMSQLLALARVEPGGGSAPQQSTPAKVIVDLVLEDLGAAAREKKVSINVSDCRPHLPGSPEFHYLLIRNLLENSIRNVPVQGQVSLRIQADAKRVVLSVADNGPGIPAAERARVFERFYRVPGSTAGGSGLGLSIVRRVVEILCGTIELSAPESGTGLIVTVTLPHARDPQASQSAA
jgi:signal transduction histidine kinase